MSTRTRKNHQKYVAYTKKITPSNCEFCRFSKEQDHVLRLEKYFYVVKNLFPYDVWDTLSVADHLLVTPKRHIDTISHFDQNEKSEFMELIAEYESLGYSLYSRPAGSIAKSVAHQHTHLIKLSGKKKVFILHLKKPRLLIAK